jgi:hypothetical protein
MLFEILKRQTTLIRHVPNGFSYAVKATLMPKVEHEFFQVKFWTCCFRSTLDISVEWMLDKERLGHVKLSDAR